MYWDGVEVFFLNFLSFFSFPIFNMRPFESSSLDFLHWNRSETYSQNSLLYVDVTVLS